MSNVWLALGLGIFMVFWNIYIAELVSLYGVSVGELAWLQWLINVAIAAVIGVLGYKSLSPFSE